MRRCARHRPDVIYVSISGFGQWGPDHDRVGYDPLAQAASGFLSLNGSPGGEPVKSPTFLADDLAGLHAALAALAALRHRDQTGEGQHVDVALLDAMLFQSTGYLTLGAMGVDLPRLGNQFRVAAPANTYRTRDGSILAGVLLDAHWRRLAELLGRAELGARPALCDGARADRAPRRGGCAAGGLGARAHQRRGARGAARARAFPPRPCAAMPRRPPIRTCARATCSRSSSARGARVPITGPAAKLSRTPARVRFAARELGADTEAVLAELGVGSDERRALRDAGVVAGPLSSENPD